MEAKSGSHFRMADGEELELQGPAGSSAGRGFPARNRAGRAASSEGSRYLASSCLRTFSIREVDLSIQQREEQIFFAVEICVESAAGITGFGGDFLQFGGFESVAGEYFFGSTE